MDIRERPEPETIEEALELIAKHPGDPYFYQQLGGLHFRRREVMEAWQAYMDALKLDPDDPFTCLYFANLLTLWDDKIYALKLYRRARNLAPTLAVVHWCIASFYRSMKKFTKADAAYRRAVTVDPSDRQAKNKLEKWELFLADQKRLDNENKA